MGLFRDPARAASFFHALIFVPLLVPDDENPVILLSEPAVCHGMPPRG